MEFSMLIMYLLLFWIIYIFLFMMLHTYNFIYNDAFVMFIDIMMKGDSLKQKLKNKKGKQATETGGEEKWSAD